MRFITMGAEKQPAILFVHGLSATAESCYGEVARRLQGKWHIILCELDGHYPGSPEFESLQRACEEIEEYVHKQHAGRIHGLIGLPLGGTIAVSLLGRGNIRVHKTLLDAAFCVDMGWRRVFFSWLFPTGVIRIRDGKWVPRFIIEKLMGKGNRSVIEMLYPGISSATLHNACRDVYAYQIPEGLKKTESEVTYWRGSNEVYPKKTAALLKKVLPGMTERVFPGMGHCQFLHEHPEEYASLLEAYLMD